MKVAYLFTEKRTGQPAASVAFVPTKDVDTAKQLLAALGFDEIPAFLDYALAEAIKTNFDVQTLDGVKLYLTGYLAFRQHKVAEKIRDAAQRQKQRQDAEQAAYHHFRRTQAADIFTGLPGEEQHAIEAQAHTHSAKFSGPLQDTMYEFNKVRMTIERYNDKLTTFEQWKATESPRTAGFA